MSEWFVCVCVRACVRARSARVSALRGGLICGVLCVLANEEYIHKHSH